MDKYCLKWNEFESNIRESFRNLREEQRLFDVTLATDDGQHIKAHKMILSAGSNFFSDIFMKTDHTNMLIYLNGTSSAVLEHVIEFLYNGEANITQEELKQVLETAQDLQIKGLQGDLQGLGQDESTNQKSGHHNINYGEYGKKQMEQNNEDILGNESILDSLEELADSFQTTETALISMDEGNPPLNTNNEILLQIEQMLEKNDGLWKCKVCAKTSRTKQNIQAHAETHIDGVSHACHICSKTFSTRHSLQLHISNIHSELFSCAICEKSGMNRAAHRLHKRVNHNTLSVKQ
jgi:hypothetical protein